jgi:hypothetical protein
MTAVVNDQQLRLALMTVLELEELILQCTCRIAARDLPLFDLEMKLPVEYSSQPFDFRLHLEIIVGPS